MDERIGRANRCTLRCGRFFRGPSTCERVVISREVACRIQDVFVDSGEPVVPGRDACDSRRDVVVCGRDAVVEARGVGCSHREVDVRSDDVPDEDGDVGKQRQKSCGSRT